MAYEKDIICLANSRKTSGRCIAGKELTDASVGGWIRPVSKRITQEISEYDRHYEDGTLPSLLDVISISFLEHRPHGCQQENHLIDDNTYWVKSSHYAAADLDDLVDTIDGALWMNGSSSYNGTNDRISVEQVGLFDSSLSLIEPEGLVISVDVEGAAFNNAKRRVRAKFRLNGHQYKLGVTDPSIEQEFLSKDNGQYPIESEPVYMCVSIGEPFHDYCYKLVASIFK